MFKKIMVTSVALGLVITSSSILSEAQEPIYDQEGNLILDVEQEAYQDLSTDDSEVEVQSEIEEQPELILDETETQTGLEEKEKSLNPKVEVQSNVANVGVTTNTSDIMGVMTPQSSTYMAGSGTTIVTTGNLNIEKVDIAYSTGLEKGAWKVSGNTLTFDNSKLDISTSGNYDFEVTFEGGSQTTFSLKLLANEEFEDYWQQNITTFSKDPRSHTHKDFELVSSSANLKITSVTIDGLAVPASSYRVHGGSLIISKSFLSGLASTPRARIAVTYGNGRVSDFSLEITDDLDEGNSSQTVDC